MVLGQEDRAKGEKDNLECSDCTICRYLSYEGSQRIL